MSQLKLNQYKQEIADLYTKRSQGYDNSQWHWKIANRLVEYGRVNRGQQVLDIATGTGHSAIAAANLVGNTGKVTRSLPPPVVLLLLPKVLFMP